MKINPNKYYVAIENRIYSITQKQYEKFKEMGGDWSTDDMNKFDAALDYIEDTGKFELILDQMYRYN